MVSSLPLCAVLSLFFESV